jgi:hypothetical protein
MKSGAPNPIGRPIIAVVCLSMVAAARLYAPHVSHGPILCLLHGLIGLPCPACGLTRSFCYLSYGHIAEAAAQNALGLPLFLLCLFFPALWFAEWLLRRRLIDWRPWQTERVAMSLGAIVALYHVSRLIWWAQSGTLRTQYFETSWTWRIIHAVLDKLSA